MFVYEISYYINNINVLLFIKRYIDLMSLKWVYIIF